MTKANLPQSPKSNSSIESRTPKPVRHGASHSIRRYWIGYLFILPWLIAFIWFDVIPFVANLLLSFTDFSIAAAWPPDWINLDNYVKMFTQDDLYLKSLSNTVFYIAYSVPLTLLLAFVIALLLNTNIRGMTIYRTIYYLPAIVPIVATSIVFVWLFNTRFGAINQVLGIAGIEPIRWLSRPQWVKPALIVMSLWGFGAQMVIFLAGLQGIPGELYESASIDGGGLWHKLRYITIPIMTPVIFFNLLIGIINSFQVFTSAFVLFGDDGGPLQAGLFYVMHIYNNAFRYFDMGYAAAMSLILFLIVLAFTLGIVWTSNRWVYYGDQ